MVCAKLKPAVSGLEKEFPPGQVKAQNVDASTPEAKKAISELGFKSHGLVVRSADGKVLHKQPDHTVNLDDARKAISEILKKESRP
jgi:hypothetical protein